LTGIGYALGENTLESPGYIEDYQLMSLNRYINRLIGYDIGGKGVDGLIYTKYENGRSKNEDIKQ